jgi:TonB family protein
MSKRFKSLATDIMNNSASAWEDSDLSLFRSAFLLLSLLLHAMLLTLLFRAASLTVAKPASDPPISVQLVEVNQGGSLNKSIGSSKGPGGPRSLPKLGNPIAPAHRSGKLDSGSLEALAPNDTVEATTAPKPMAFPGPKVLSSDSSRESVNVKETSPDSLVRLPTKEAATNLTGGVAIDPETSQKSLAALKSTDLGAGIKGLREGEQIPGSLKGAGTGVGPYGAPGGSRSGSGLSGGGSGSGTGGGSHTGLKGISSSDYNQYLQQLKRRVESVWKYPDDVTGVQKVAVRFILDRAGKLTLAEVLDSSDSRLNSSAVEAIRRASPFPPIPETLKDLANEPMIIRFEVAIRVRG